MSERLGTGSIEVSSHSATSGHGGRDSARTKAGLRERSLVCSLSFALIAVLFLAALLLSSCASRAPVGWTEDEGVPADGTDSAAYGASNFTVRKKNPTHDETRKDFYYKHCDLDSPSTSKTAYFCNDF